MKPQFPAMRKLTLLAAVLLALAASATAVATMHWLRATAADLRAWLHAHGVTAELALVAFPWPHLRIERLATDFPNGTGRMGIHLAAARLSLDPWASLRRHQASLRATLNDLHVEWQPHSDVEDDAARVWTWAGQALAFAFAHHGALPAWLTAGSIEGAALTRVPPGAAPQRLVRLSRTEWEQRPPASLRFRATGVHGEQERRFDLSATWDELTSGQFLLTVRGAALLGEDVLLELAPLELEFLRNGMLRSASGSGRIAGANLSVRVAHRPPEAAAEPHGVAELAFALEHAQLAPLVNDFFLDFRGLVTGRVSLRGNLRIPVAPLRQGERGSFPLDEAQGNGTLSVEELRVGQTNVLYGLLLTALRARDPQVPALPDELRYAFPELLVRARSYVRRAEASWELEDGGVRLQHGSATGPGFALTGSGRWTVAPAEVDLQLELRLDEPLVHAFCKAAASLPPCAEAAVSGTQGVRFPFRWQGRLADKWPAIRLSDAIP